MWQSHETLSEAVLSCKEVLHRPLDSCDVLLTCVYRSDIFTVKCRALDCMCVGYRYRSRRNIGTFRPRQGELHEHIVATKSNKTSWDFQNGTDRAVKEKGNTAQSSKGCKKVVKQQQRQPCNNRPFSDSIIDSKGGRW